jgi:hypothetical protein
MSPFFGNLSSLSNDGLDTLLRDAKDAYPGLLDGSGDIETATRKYRDIFFSFFHTLMRRG